MEEKKSSTSTRSSSIQLDDNKPFLPDQSGAVCCKTKKRNDDELKSLMNRLNRIEGQVRGIKRMLESDAYCVDILTQVSAVGSALNGFSKELLANHLRTCVVEDIKNDKEETIDELVDLLRKLMK